MAGIVDFYHEVSFRIRKFEYISYKIRRFCEKKQKSANFFSIFWGFGGRFYVYIIVKIFYEKNKPLESGL